MAIYCGVDIVEIDRIKESFDRLGQSFRDRIFTPGEIAYCEGRQASRFQSYAARFAAKEAISKAFGTGIGKRVGWKDIEILNHGNGKPYVVLSNGARELLGEMGATEVSLSLSHCKNYAVAYAVIEVVK